LVFYEEDESDDAKSKAVYVLSDTNWADFSGQVEGDMSGLYISLSRLFHWYNILNDPGNAPLNLLAWVSATLLNNPNSRKNFLQLAERYCHQSSVIETAIVKKIGKSVTGYDQQGCQFTKPFFSRSGRRIHSDTNDQPKSSQFYDYTSEELSMGGGLQRTDNRRIYR